MNLPRRMLAAMTCCSLLVALTLSMGYGDIDVGDGGRFATPMFLRGRPVWVTPVSRRLLRQQQSRPGKDTERLPETDVAALV